RTDHEPELHEASPAPDGIKVLREEYTRDLLPHCLPCLLFKHYILAFSGILAIPLILAEPLCIKDNNAAKSQLISTIFFVSGICTMLQTTIGTRLPILQGGTFTFITPTLAILALPKWQCPKGSVTPDLNATVASVSHLDPEEVWKMRIREVHVRYHCFSKGVEK
ncbi:solute carrier family 23 member 2, partial [Tachysurus ichikawai]